MIHESKENKITIYDSEVTIEFLKTKKFFPIEFTKEIENCDVLLFPYENFKGYNKPLFPELTVDLFEFARNKNINIEICISNDKYEELGLHSKTINIPLILCTAIVAPILVNLISNFLIEKNTQNRENNSVKMSIVVKKGDTQKEINYEGSAKDFKELISPSLKEMFEEK